MTLKSTTYSGLLLLAAVSIASPALAGGFKMPIHSCEQTLQIAVDLESFLKVIDQNAIVVKRKVQESFPSFNNPSEIASSKNLQRLIDYVVEELAVNPAAFLTVTDKARSLLKNNSSNPLSLTPQQEVAVFMAARTDGFLKYLILSAAEIPNREARILADGLSTPAGVAAPSTGSIFRTIVE